MPNRTRRRIPRPILIFSLFFFTAAAAHAGLPIELDPAGPIAGQERDLILITSGLMLLVLIPVFAMTGWFAWQYRAGNKKALYMPKWESMRVDAVAWFAPAVIVAILAGLTWVYTHKLDPYKPIASEQEPLHVQVVSLNWKWLFIYPEQGIASLNQLVIPTNRPVSFDITSDTVMTSFFIPQLGSQIYAMAGMNTQLHLQADRTGTFLGENTQFSGSGFSDNNFDVLAKTDGDFNAWVREVKAKGGDLDWAKYQQVAEPSVKPPVSEYAKVDTGLYDRIMHKYMRGMSADGVALCHTPDKVASGEAAAKTMPAQTATTPAANPAPEKNAKAASPAPAKVASADAAPAT